MIGICFFLEEHTPAGSGVIAYPIEAERWIFNARNLGATHVLIIDQTQHRIGKYLSFSDGEIQVEIFDSLVEAQAAFQVDVEWVYFENEATVSGVPLSGFNHPDSAIYVVGGNYCGIAGIVGLDEIECVNLPVENLFAEAAGVVILWDRLWR